MVPKKKIIFVLPNLCAGGSERVIAFISQNIDATVYDVKLIVIGFKKDAVYEINTVEHEFLNKSRLLYAVSSLYRVLSRENPNIIISSISHLNLMMGMFSFFFKKIKFVGRESSVVSRMNDFTRFNSRLNILLMRFLYPRLAAIICQSEDMRTDFIEKIGIKSDKLVLINNPITSTFQNFDEHSIPPIQQEELRFITVGRLSGEKGHLRIIDALSQIKSYPFHYTIVGTGPLAEEIKQKIQSLGLSDQTTFIDYTAQVYDELLKHHYFIQGSFVEGFPNALLESCSVGIPVIAFNAPGGTKEIVQEGINGFLVDSTPQLVELLNDRFKLASIDSQKVKESVHNKFNANQIIQQYELLFQKLSS